jgi:tRNA pseudouridine13 synthase
MPLTPAAGDPTLVLPFAHGGPVLQGVLKGRPEDFVVDELLGYGPSGAGEHLFLTVRKRERNTHEVARAIARLAGIAQVDVGYAGLKDRNALTTQSFTVRLAGRPSPDWSMLEDNSLRILSIDRHARKIRRGSLRGNRFRIHVGEVRGQRELAEARLAAIARYGAPNYFGSQRFGRRGQNLVRVQQLFSGQGPRPGREQRGLLLSAARAHLFNLVAAARVADGSWARALPGDVLAPKGSRRLFPDDPSDATIASRVQCGELHATGPLCGTDSRAPRPAAAAAEIEDSVLAPWGPWCDGLRRYGLEADRRPLRLAVEGLSWEWRDAGLTLAFTLPAGAYATALLRELVVEPADAGQSAPALRDSST